MNLRAVIKDQVAQMVAPVARTLTAARLRILMYHRFGPDGTYRRLGTSELERQIRYLKRNFRPARLDDVVQRLRAGRRLDPRTVVLTVDDGYSDFAQYAYPVLERHGVPATVYVVSRFAQQECWLWFDAVQWLVDQAPNGQLHYHLAGSDIRIKLAQEEDRRRLWSIVADLCVTRSPAEQWSIVADFAQQLKVKLPALPTAQFAAMSWEDLRRMNPDIVEIGAHTVSHPILSKCSTELQRQEVAECKAHIERMLGREVRAFCYPNGMPEDFTAETESIVSACGYSSAVMACGGFASSTSPLYRLERLGAPESMPLFCNAVNGLWHLRGTG